MSNSFVSTPHVLTPLPPILYPQPHSCSSPRLSTLSSRIFRPFAILSPQPPPWLPWPPCSSLSILCLLCPSFVHPDRHQEVHGDFLLPQLLPFHVCFIPLCTLFSLDFATFLSLALPCPSSLPLPPPPWILCHFTLDSPPFLCPLGPFWSLLFYVLPSCRSALFPHTSPASLGVASLSAPLKSLHVLPSLVLRANPFAAPFQTAG